MRVTPAALLACATSLLLPSTHAQPSGADTQQLTVLHAKAESGDARAESELGDAYFLGSLGLQKNEVEGVKWLRKAATQNVANAQLNLGNC